MSDLERKKANPSTFVHVIASSDVVTIVGRSRGGSLVTGGRGYSPEITIFSNCLDCHVNLGLDSSYSPHLIPKVWFKKMTPSLPFSARKSLH